MSTANLSCPFCGFEEKDVEIPANKCQHAYVCRNCGKTMESREGECCVFCSFADRKCDMALQAEKGET